MTYKEIRTAEKQIASYLYSKLPYTRIDVNYLEETNEFKIEVESYHNGGKIKRTYIAGYDATIGNGNDSWWLKHIVESFEEDALCTKW